jgi:hypothetical protein
MLADREWKADLSGPHKSPLFAEEQEQPEPERPTTPLEDAEQDLASLQDPPQAEGARDPGDEL